MDNTRVMELLGGTPSAEHEFEFLPRRDETKSTGRAPRKVQFFDASITRMWFPTQQHV